MVSGPLRLRKRQRDLWICFQFGSRSRRVQLQLQSRIIHVIAQILLFDNTQRSTAKGRLIREDSSKIVRALLSTPISYAPPAECRRGTVSRYLAYCMASSMVSHIFLCYRMCTRCCSFSCREHDKNPSSLCDVLLALKADGYRFRASLLGEQYEEKPGTFSVCHAGCSASWRFRRSTSPPRKPFRRTPPRRLFAFETRLLSAPPIRSCRRINRQPWILRSGHVSCPSSLLFRTWPSLLCRLEAAYCGSYPICPNRLVYPEIFPPCCLYNTDKQLIKMLKNFCKRPDLARKQRQALGIDFGRYSWSTLRDQYRALLS